MTPRRLYVPVVLATLATGGLAFFAAGRTWAEADVRAQGLGHATISVSGGDAQPLVPALAVVVLTAALAILAAGRRMRRVIGVLTMLVAAAAIVAVPRSGTDALQDAVRSAAEESAAYTGPASLGSISYAPWDLVTIAAFVLAIALGAVTLRLAPQWPTMSSRYDAPGSRPAAKDDSGTEMWKAMDRGDDPTA
ncbi:Trp biosynthesis-associated membrane protein [Aeromicrobium wangtongii]|uniref:Trp biosynthesis-associated membrane protein n=1 Tax=Aeromicrobium wangtongii TaxID=2969247 RepID=UPI002016AFA8|nr:Trp biosynthesis-associated membrane protein [Aeromicrobium wangtongii]MCL3818498.1 Trp biosynthesis-associated membrane protein [Aeromicrobium wangtongii]